MCVYVCVWASVHFSIPVFICATLPQSEEAAAAAATAGKAKEAKAKKKNKYGKEKIFCVFLKLKNWKKTLQKYARSVAASLLRLTAAATPMATLHCKQFVELDKDSNYLLTFY